MAEAARETKHSIQVVSSRTGLSPDVIRAWERRYGAVSPERSATRRRLYSDEDVERLVLLRRATLAGRRIGEVAHLSLPELATLAREDSEALARVPAAAGARSPQPNARAYYEAGLQAARRMDAVGLGATLSRAATELTVTALFEEVISPLLETVGEQWLRGKLSIAHEHLTTAVIRSRLEGLRAALSDPLAESTLVAATPAGEYHELGALKAAVLGAVDGWRSVYLGPNLPAAQIAEAAGDLGARAVALSVVYVDHDAGVERELRALGELLPKGAALLIGGRAVEQYQPLLSRMGALVVADMVELRRELSRLR